MAKKIHFIGCEGISMRMLRNITENQGALTSGSDIALNGHDEKNVLGADLVVYTAAIDAENPELKYAKSHGIPTMTRGEYLGEICSSYERSVSISGAHGKTTTTAMLWEVLKPLNPTVHIGGSYKGKNGCVGGGLFITEACEYKRSFLSLKPDIAIILNVDLDHTDCYKDLCEMGEAFKTFASQAKQAVIVGEGFNVDKANVRVLKVGMGNNCDFFATDLHADSSGRYSFNVHNKHGLLGGVKLSVSGRHNVCNALFTLAAALEIGMDFDSVSINLHKFKGVMRRMELLGEKNGCAVFSDYAHHPGEIVMSLSSVKESAYKHITVVFEPHTYTRTKSFYKEFADALSLADSVILLPVYAAREVLQKDGESCLIAAALENKGRSAVCLNSYNEVKEYLNASIIKEGVIIFMGAGTVDVLAREFI